MIGHVSSFAPALARESLVQQMQSELTDVTNEISSGRKTKPGGGSQLYELHLAADQQTAVQTVITNANNRLGVIQNALDGISSVAQQVSSATIDPGTADGDSQSVLASQARDAMDQVVGLMNTRDNGQAVFAGSDG